MKVNKEMKKNILDNPNDYIKCGTDGFSRTYVDKSKWNYIGMLYFKKCYPDKDFPKHTNLCICGHYICENCYITTKDMDYNNILIIGNCCYKYCIGDLRTNCLECNEPHVNGISRDKGLCNNCKETIKNEKKSIKRQIRNESVEMLKKYKSYIDNMKEELITNFNILFNSVKVLKLFKAKRTLSFVYTSNYSIANIYNNLKLVYRMNLVSLLPTKTSPSQLNFQSKFSMY